MKVEVGFFLNERYLHSEQVDLSSNSWDVTCRDALTAAPTTFYASFCRRNSPAPVCSERSRGAYKRLPAGNPGTSRRYPQMAAHQTRPQSLGGKLCNSLRKSSWRQYLGYETCENYRRTKSESPEPFKTKRGRQLE